MRYTEQIQNQLVPLLERAKQALSDSGSDEAATLLEQRFNTVFEALDDPEEYIHRAQDAVSNLITMHPNLTPLVARELLWQLGGSCLHFLGDEEIEHFSAESELH